MAMWACTSGARRRGLGGMSLLLMGGGRRLRLFLPSRLRGIRGRLVLLGLMARLRVLIRLSSRVRVGLIIGSGRVGS